MKVLEIKNIERKDVPIYYRRLYTGTAVLQLVTTTAEIPIDFQIEQKPTGVSEIGITFSKQVDYPLVPLRKELKKYIDSLNSNGKLPD